MQLPRAACWRRWIACLLGAFGLTLTVHAVAEAHATLLRSSPASNAVLSSSPASVRLEFSEEIDLSVSRVVVVGDSGSVALELSLDPHDVHVLVGRLPSLPSGAYRVTWATVSADGHAVHGQYVFRVGAANALAPRMTASVVNGPRQTGVSLQAALRACGDFSLSLTAGLLLFVWLFAATGTAPARASRAMPIAALATVVLMAGRDVAWVVGTAPARADVGQWTASLLATQQGIVEVARLGLALLVVWALLLMRRRNVALAFAALALACTGAVGHALAIQPLAAVPLKAAHALAMSAWLGGLVWIVARERLQDAEFYAEAVVVSKVAFASVLVLALSGLGMTALFLPLRASALHSAYAELVALKLLGLVGLATLGFVQRRRRLPRVELDAAAGDAMRRLARYEIAVMLLVFALGACLSYTTPHP